LGSVSPGSLVCSNVAEVSLEGGVVGTDNEEVMSWLESSLEYARDRNQVGLARLLKSVRAEVVWETELAKRRGRSTGHPREHWARHMPLETEQRPCARSAHLELV
jgi:hypothetical protein